MPKTATKPTAATKPRAAGPGLSKPVTPSPELAAVIGAEPRPRSAVTASVWGHIKAHGLQDAADKRIIVADDVLRPIIGDKCTMFELPGRLAKHMAA